MNNLFSMFRQTFYTAAFIMGCCFVCGCENDEKEIDEWSKPVVMVDEAITVESFMSQQGVMKAKLTAPLMLRVAGSGAADTVYVEFPKALHVDFYDDSTKIETWLDSKYGKYYETLDKVYLRDSVVVISIKGDTLKCPDLWWDQNKRLFYCDKYAQYHAKGKDIFGGKGLEATQDMNTVTFKEPVGVVEVSNSGVLQ